MVCTWLACCGSVAAPELYHIMRYAIAVQETGAILRGEVSGAQDINSVLSARAVWGTRLTGGGTRPVK